MLISNNLRKWIYKEYNEVFTIILIKHFKICLNEKTKVIYIINNDNYYQYRFFIINLVFIFYKDK